MAETMGINLEVFDRYSGLSLPRHVSYPMPSWWHDVDESQAADILKLDDKTRAAPDVSLYLHIPFCEKLCKFCACNKVILPRTAPDADARVRAYVDALTNEIRTLGEAVGADRDLRHIHWGGGSPTYLSADQIENLHRAIKESFRLDPAAEIAIEVDARITSAEMLARLRRMGFNRISLGVQDFDEQVQSHVHRVQSFEMIRDTVSTCRELGFESINFDLIYGMPYQTPQTIRDTVERSISLSPDRVAYYHYAQIPDKIASQRGMDYTKLPDSKAKLDMLLIGIELFEAAGYEFVGLDHFAKPDEGLCAARDDGTLQRNFQGMTTGAGLDLLGVGASSISHVLGVGFVQNIKDHNRYVACIAAGGTPAQRGKRLTPDDIVRQILIDQLYSYGEIRRDVIEARAGIEFETYFARELDIMRELERDELVSIEPDGTIRATMPLGRVLLRNIAAVFDAYLDADAYRTGQSACFSANA